MLRPKRDEEKRRRRGSEFEERVHVHLAASGYQLLEKYAVGEYELDLVVEGTNGRRSAIQCDGDRAFDLDGLVEGMEGQITLERLGWEFLRVRASEFYRSPDRTLKKLERRLAGLEIRPLPEGSAVAVRDTKPAPHRGAPPS